MKAVSAPTPTMSAMGTRKIGYGLGGGVDERQ
jgi:hypothetical protein